MDSHAPAFERGTHDFGNEADRDRAQTALDFAIGASVFLVVVAFVVAFIPGLLAPFEAVEPTQAADRFAITLAGDLLTDPASGPADGRVIDPVCTAAFFTQMQDDATETTDCRFDGDDTDLRSTLATDHAVNVTIENRTGEIATMEYDGENTPLRAGPSAGGRAQVTVSRQVVLLDGRSHRLVVRVW
ncbi:hypothetical protein ACFQAS_07180 [Halopenitus salinus]|uniref:Uncharacterized protein n=1 Tax=Halopenitus salinus TaxID=1198295 RepID=A0ABD5V3V8_9EURY